MTAAHKDAPEISGRIRVATKYVKTPSVTLPAKAQAEIIKLYGSMELAPLVGLADCIVDPLTQATR
jgi:ATP phosphoribosyltransferase